MGCRSRRIPRTETGLNRSVSKTVPYLIGCESNRYCASHGGFHRREQPKGQSEEDAAHYTSRYQGGAELSDHPANDRTIPGDGRMRDQSSPFGNRSSRPAVKRIAPSAYRWIAPSSPDIRAGSAIALKSAPRHDQPRLVRYGKFFHSGLLENLLRQPRG